MALYSTKGTISAMSDVTSGVSQSGRGWQRMTLVIDVPAYQGAVIKQAFQVTGESVDDVMNFHLGDKVEVSWTMYAREYNGKWYPNVELVKIYPQDAAAPAPATEAKAQHETNAGSDDLPF